MLANASLEIFVADTFPRYADDCKLIWQQTSSRETINRGQQLTSCEISRSPENYRNARVSHTDLRTSSARRQDYRGISSSAVLSYARQLKSAIRHGEAGARAGIRDLQPRAERQSSARFSRGATNPGS